MYFNRAMSVAMLLGSLSLFPAASSVAGQAFAPRAKVAEEIVSTYLGKNAAESVIPDQERVGIPAYPGAVVIRTYAIDQRPATYEGLPIVELITTDEYQAVVDYYKKELPSWRNAELMSAYYFAKHGNLNFFTPTEPHVGVHNMETYYLSSDREVLRKMLPGAKTLIKVFIEK